MGAERYQTFTDVANLLVTLQHGFEDESKKWLHVLSLLFRHVPGHKVRWQRQVGSHNYEVSCAKCPIFEGPCFNRMSAREREFHHVCRMRGEFIGLSLRGSGTPVGPIHTACVCVCVCLRVCVREREREREREWENERE